ncbi:SpoIIE family protein phosphatase [Streptomyces sp. NPDC101227]|uniref:SpoIIE family protein phosphatase n=1 Tax=Streptomyces sp. NPDC101227 TaxID=3366136 RepID=UPI003828E18D
MHDARFDTLGDLPEPGGEAYATVDQRGVLASWSAGAQRLLGYLADEIRGRHIRELLYERADGARLVARCRATETPFIGQAALRHRDGSRVDVGMWAHLLEPAGGEPCWLIRAEHAADVRRQSLGRALLRGLFTESPFHIDVFDTQLHFIAQNARRLKNFADHDFVGRTMRDVAPAGIMDMETFDARQRQVLDTGEALVATEVRTHPLGAPERYQAFSETIVPLRSGAGETIGLAHIVFEITDRVRARERLTLLNDASAKIGSTLDVLHTAQELTDTVVPPFADHAYVDLLEPVLGGEEPVSGPIPVELPLRRAATSRIPEDPVKTVGTGETDPFACGPASLFHQALAGGEPLLLTGEEVLAELSAVDPRRAAATREYGVHSWLLVPMFARGAALGAAVFMRSRGEHAFELDDVLLAEDLVARAAVCIDNARRYTRERTTALALQRSLLPQRMPLLGAVEAASRYLPASGSTVLGGAWFDVIPLSGARVALVVGDVPGHGLHSAVTMGRLRTAVRTLSDLDLSPEELLIHLDDQVNRFQAEHGEGRAGGAAGSTCLYAVFDPLTRRCAMARAGHPPPARAAADGSVRFLDLPGGPPLGRGGATFECGEATVTDGDLLILYADGLASPQDRSAEPAPAWLREALSDPRLTASPRLDGVCDAVIRHLPSPRPQDDVALLVARVRGLDPDRHITWELAAEPETVSAARRLTTQKLAEWGLGDLEFTTELMVSELVTNAIRYGAPPIRLRLIRDRSLICEVTDGSSTSPHIRRAQDTDEGGRGLFMVAQFAQLWGTRYHTRGKTIWAEQPLPEGDPVLHPR